MKPLLALVLIETLTRHRHSRQPAHVTHMGGPLYAHSLQLGVCENVTREHFGK